MKQKILKVGTAFLAALMLLAAAAPAGAGRSAAAASDADAQAGAGTVTVAVEAFTVGGGYLAAPVRVALRPGDRASQVLDRALSQAGLPYQNGGSLTSSFYLTAVQAGQNGQKFGFTPALPACLAGKVSFDASGWDGKSLGESDFGPTSGWMCTLNGKFPDMGLSDVFPKDGDVLRAQFTLSWSSDIGGWDSFFPVADKDALTALLASVNSSADREAVLAESGVQAAYDAAVKTLETLDASQSAVDAAQRALQAALDGKPGAADSAVENGKTSAGQKTSSSAAGFGNAAASAGAAARADESGSPDTGGAAPVSVVVLLAAAATAAGCAKAGRARAGKRR